MHTIRKPFLFGPLLRGIAFGAGRSRRLLADIDASLVESSVCVRLGNSGGLETMVAGSAAA